jgi:uncharacterized membrane protein|tara:strand:- start:146 stop:526 length:381 start_codon:yes stop_codon:yes gene_type:complete
MNPFDNILVRLSVFSSIYVIVLIFLAPLIDHSFTSLEEDKLIEESNYQILAEIILHVIVLTITWYFLHKYLSQLIEKLLNVKMRDATRTAIDFISAIALVGLQTNLIAKLRYITLEHPFRMADLYR